jgi:hypothetical protein
MKHMETRRVIQAAHKCIILARRKENKVKVMILAIVTSIVLKMLLMATVPREIILSMIDRIR